MNLDRKIVLIEPGAVTKAPDGSDITGPSTRHLRSARRQASVGSEGVTADTAISEDRVEYTIRWFNDVTTRWLIEDSGLMFRIESVYEASMGRRQFMKLRATSRN